MTSFLIDPYRFRAPYDIDAQTYITAAETADGQALESGVKDAINAFVVGCKADGIWTPIRHCCILAGARTLTGALTPLKGTAPTNNNFVSGDYNRKTGLIGDASTKYLDSNVNPSQSPMQQNSAHGSVYLSTALGDTHSPFGAQVGTSPIFSMNRVGTGSNLEGHINASYPSGSMVNTSGGGATGFMGMNRSSSTSSVLRAAGTEVTSSGTSVSPPNRNIHIFGRNMDSGSFIRTNARMAFYSIGDSLTLSLLDSRVTTLINAIAAAIP